MTACTKTTIIQKISEKNNQSPIQKILGHENRTTTEIYLHTMGNAERDAIALLDSCSEEKSHTDSHTEAKKVSSKS